MGEQSVYIKCVNCGKQNLILPDDRRDSKCEFGNHPVMIKIRQEPKRNIMNTKPGTGVNAPSSTGPSTVPEPVSSGSPLGRELPATSAPLYEGIPRPQIGKRKWAKRCRECEFSYTYDKTLYCPKKHCSQNCPKRLRPPYRPHIEGKVHDVPPRPSGYKARQQYYEENKELILKDFYSLPWSTFLKKWHLKDTTAKSLLEKWEVPFSDRGKFLNIKPKKEKPKVKIVNLLASAEPPLPELPSFNNKWAVPVQIEWLKARVRIMELNNERYRNERRFTIQHLLDESYPYSPPVKRGFLSRLFNKKGG